MRFPGPLLYAHRGAALEQPENTLPAFRRALDLGAHALETDAHMTADGHVVVAHDPTGERTAGVARAIREATLAEVQSWDVAWGFRDAQGARPFAGQRYTVPTLEQVLVEFPGVPTSVDLKQRRPSMLSPVLALLKRLRAEQHVLLASFDASVLRAVRRAGYPGPTGLGTSEVARLALAPMAALRVFPPKGTAAQVPTRAWGITLGAPWFIARCHALGLRAMFWTVNDPAQARTLLDLGADGIVTDDVRAIATVF